LNQDNKEAKIVQLSRQPSIGHDSVNAERKMKKKSLTDVKSKPLKNSSVWQPVCQKQDPASASGIQTRKKH